MKRPSRVKENAVINARVLACTRGRLHSSFPRAICFIPARELYLSVDLRGDYTLRSYMRNGTLTKAFKKFANQNGAFTQRMQQLLSL